MNMKTITKINMIVKINMKTTTKLSIKNDMLFEQ